MNSKITRTPEPAPPTAAEIAKRFPEAVQFARAMRAEFGDGVKLLYARNRDGEELGKPAV